MAPLLSCEFNMDTVCVELKFADGSMISIDCTAVENEIADNICQRSMLDYLIYNRPVRKPYKFMLKVINSANQRVSQIHILEPSFHLK